MCPKPFASILCLFSKTFPFHKYFNLRIEKLDTYNVYLVLGLISGCLFSWEFPLGGNEIFVFALFPHF